MSKFSGLLQAKQGSLQESKGNNNQPPAAEELTNPTEKTDMPAENAAVADTRSAAMNMQPGRGKKGHPNYNQVTIYLRKETHNKAKIALLQSGDERDFSELVEDLLNNFLNG